MRNGTGGSAGNLFSVFQTLTARPALMNWTQLSSALVVLIVLCFSTERTNLFNNRRIVSCRFEELKRLSKHFHQKNTPRTVRAHCTHGVATASVRVMRKKPAFHACHSRHLYRYLLNSYCTQNQRKNRHPTHTHQYIKNILQVILPHV